MGVSIQAGTIYSVCVLLWLHKIIAVTRKLHTKFTKFTLRKKVYGNLRNLNKVKLVMERGGALSKLARFIIFVLLWPHKIIMHGAYEIYTSVRNLRKVTNGPWT